MGRWSVTKWSQPSCKTAGEAAYKQTLHMADVPQGQGKFLDGNFSPNDEQMAVLQEAAAVEAETQKVFAENQSLNKQQGALNAEVAS